FFFFQAEDGIRDFHVTGVQTCALPIYLEIRLPEMLYERVVEVDERVLADGTVEIQLDEEAARRDLQAAYDAGIRSTAIVFMHAYRYHDHEQRVAEIARETVSPQCSSRVVVCATLPPHGSAVP